MKAVIGLGNPGKKYEKTRHNIGFLVLDAFLKKKDHASFSAWSLSKKYNALISEGFVNEEKIILVKPMTFMNASGHSVQLVAQFYHLSHDDLLVVHDDKDLPLGEIKVQKDRGDAGHNGVRSLVAMLGTKNFARVRVGIRSHDEKKMKDTAAFVLQKFAFGERKALKDAIAESLRHVETFMDQP